MAPGHLDVIQEAPAGPNGLAGGRQGRRMAGWAGGQGRGEWLAMANTSGECQVLTASTQTAVHTHFESLRCVSPDRHGERSAEQPGPQAHTSLRTGPGRDR